MKIDELNLSIRTFNCLSKAGITTVEELQEKKEDEIRSIKGMSDRKIIEIRMALERAESRNTSVPVGKKKEEISAVDKYNSNISTIKNLLIDAAMDFCAVGFYLKEIRDKEQYKEAGYSSIWECAYEEFGLSKSAASRHMKMNDLYSVNGNSAELDKKYISFNKSQLQEMMSLPDSERENVTPETQVAEIRKMNPNSKASKESVATSQQPEVMKEVITPVSEPVAEAQKEQENFILSIRDNCIFDSSVKCNIHNAKEVAKSIGIDCKYNCCSSCNEDCGARCNTSAHKNFEYSKSVAISQQEDSQTFIDAEYQEVVEEPKSQQPELPVLKNMEQREQFLRNYQSWPVWCKNELTEETFYRYELPDGSAVVVKEYPTWLDWRKEDRIQTRYYLVKPGLHHFADAETNMTTLKDHMKEVQK